MKSLPRFCATVVSIASVITVHSLAGAEGAALKSPIRIKAGVTKPLTDETGTVWEADRGFIGGETIERPGIAIANTRTPSVYRAERYSMTGFTQALPNGAYIVKLHFAETFEGVTAARERVFSFTVEGKEFKDFDVYVKAHGPGRAYIETVPVEIKDGKLDITFASNIENPQINAIEILPDTKR
jgi:endoglucanase